MNIKTNKKNGFTILEIVLVISILTVLLMISFPAFRGFIDRIKLDNESERMISLLEEARARTLASEDDGQWGVYFSTSTSPHEAVIFSGPDYASRLPGSEETYRLPENVEFSSVKFPGQTAVFERLTGFSGQGSTTLSLISDPSESVAVFVSALGHAGTAEEAPGDESGLAKDARRVRFRYDSSVSSTSDSLVLYFDGGSTVLALDFAEHMSGGNFDWQGSVLAGGENQALRIHTTVFDGPETVFCVHRDSGANSKSLGIDLDSDMALTPNLLHIEADGSAAVKGNSMFVGEPEMH